MARAVPILMYHRIGAPRRDSIVAAQYVSEARLRLQVRLLKRMGFVGVPLERVREAFDLPGRHIAITFDDGYRSFATGAQPHLRAAGFPSTVFLVSGQIGGTNAWDTAKGDVEEPLLAAVEIQGLAVTGVHFGSHTRNHPNLTSLGPEAMASEIAGSKQDLEALLGTSVDWFCYPYGAQNATVRDAARAAGYLGACSIEKGLNGPETDVFELRRINVRTSMTAIRFWWRLARSSRPL